MFPQTELDNYKLQVELLQEKLQRSEISRQQLEHKLEKLVSKRQEQDKVSRLKSKQKYQHFLDEQQQRNERNKQLVQMLERIEQQTSAMNARSERLKMMKLQYEMYFAKLVHSQTRRCIQSSVAGTPHVIDRAPLPRAHSGGPTLMMSATSMEGLNYANAYAEQQPLLGNVYQSFPDSRIERDHDHFLTQKEPKITEPSLSDYALHSERSDYYEIGKPDLYQVQLRQQRYDEHMPIREFDERSKQRFKDSIPITNDNVIYKNIGDSSGRQQNTMNLDLPTSESSASARISFERIPTEFNASHTSSSSIPTFANENILSDLNLNKHPTVMQPPRFQQNPENQLEIKPNMINLVSELPSNGKIIQQTEIKQIPKEMQMLAPQNDKLGGQLPNYTNPQEKQQMAINEVKGEDMTTNSQQPAVSIPSSTVPVSLENIENAIYGELLNPIEDSQQIPEKPRVSPELLQNLVTQDPAALETQAEALDENIAEQRVSEPNNAIYKNETALENSELPVNNPQTNEQAYSSVDDGKNIMDDQNKANVDYTEYERNKAVVEGENHQQQQPQDYDYTNYDPSQYSYPGYIYDETTGEYKPDPNATAEQYATDQQYAQDYDPQYQQEGYDYNQAYEQQQTGEIDPGAYTTYDTTQQSEEPTTPSTDTDITTESAKQEQNLDPQNPITDINNTNDSATKPPLGEENENSAKNIKPILATTEKNDQQKKKKRVNFVESSETDSTSTDKAATQQGAVKQPNAGNESDFDFSSGSDAAAKS